MQACGKSLITASRFSFAPFGEPGNVKISVWLRTPAMGRAIAATNKKCQQPIIGSFKVYLHGVTASDVASMVCLVSPRQQRVM
jgi:hypothetical protein